MRVGAKSYSKIWCHENNAPVLRVTESLFFIVVFLSALFLKMEPIICA